MMTNILIQPKDVEAGLVCDCLADIKARPSPFVTHLSNDRTTHVVFDFAGKDMREVCGPLNARRRPSFCLEKLKALPLALVE